MVGVCSDPWGINKGYICKVCAKVIFRVEHTVLKAYTVFSKICKMEVVDAAPLVYNNCFIYKSENMKMTDKVYLQKLGQLKQGPSHCLDMLAKTRTMSALY
jgi:hypothetical protein